MKHVKAQIYNQLNYECVNILFRLGGEINIDRQLDPRLKLLILFILNILSTFSGNLKIELSYISLLVLCMLYQKQYKEMIQDIVIYGILYGMTLSLLVVGGYAAVLVAAFLAFMRKVFPIYMGAQLLISSSVGKVICALQKLHLPKNLMIGLTVALRFFPTIGEEFHSIRDAMQIRGIPFTAKNCVCHPKATIEFVLVPMIARLSLISDELSSAVITRGIERVGNRTSYYVMKWKVLDTVILFLFLCLLFLAFVQL